MAGQYELCSKHLEYKTQAQSAISGINTKNVNEAVKALFAKGYGFIPSANAACDDYLGLALSLEEIAKSNPEAASLLIDQIILQEFLLKFGNENAKDLFNTSEVYAVLCLEPGISLMDSLSTKAQKTAKGWKIQGQKQISNEQLNADKFVIFTKVDNADKLEKNEIRLFITSKKNINPSQIGKNIAGSNIALNQLSLNLELSNKDNIAVISGDTERILCIARTLIAAVSLGIGHSAIITSVNTCKEVKGHEGQAISNTQSAQIMLADMFAELEAGRMLTYYSANLIDTNKHSIKQATMAKVQSTEAAASISMQALHILGNLGFIANNEFAPMLQVALSGQIKGGTNRVQKNLIYQYMLAKK